MLTILTTAKPFKGHNGTIQRNALQSWKLLDRGAEIIVFGNDEGAAEACAALDIRHEPNVERTGSGAVLVNAMFARAQAIARHEVVCYVNCDIVLMGDFLRAVERVKAAHPAFLMVGQRWDVDITEPLEFDQHDWQARLVDLVRKHGKQRPGDWIDYFAFSRGLYGADIPPFAIGRTSWDNWLVWKILDSKKPVVDASPAVIAVHQNHDYTHHVEGARGVWKGEEARRNYELAGGPTHLGTIDDATVILEVGGLRRNYKRHWFGLKRHAGLRYAELMRVLTYKVWLPIWHSFLGITRPMRGVLGLRSKAMRARQERR
jgi:hypothetical protein